MIVTTYDFKLLEKSTKERKKTFQVALKKANNPKTIKQLPQLHDAAFQQIDCLQCANCCKNYSPRFKGPDIKRISKYMRMKESEFIQQYLQIDTDEDHVLQSHPCPFLDVDNYCQIYDVRPRDCARYPYTDEDVFVKQPNLSMKNAAVCPAAHAVVEMLSQKLPG